MKVLLRTRWQKSPQRVRGWWSSKCVALQRLKIIIRNCGLAAGPLIENPKIRFKYIFSTDKYIFKYFF